MNILSLKVLQESQVVGNELDHKLFEEVVYLTRYGIGRKLDVTYREDVLKLLNKELPDYQNPDGETVTWTASGIVEIFETNLAELNLPERFTEVFSRMIIMPPVADKEAVYQKYYPDYVWEKTL